MRKLFLVVVMVLPSLLLAKDLKIESKAGKFNVVKITASEVKGVSLRLSQVISRNDCNHRGLNFKLTPVDGNKDVAWYQTAYVAANTMMTAIHCPLPKPVIETIYSQAVTLPSLMNENANGEVNLTVIVPASYMLEAAEVLK